MPRYGDGYGTRLYVGHLSARTRSRDLEHIFSRYGRIRDVDMKRDYAFVEFCDPRDADDARYKLDGVDVDGRRIAVEFARGVPRGPGGTREYGGKDTVPGSGRCFNCGIEGHWARDCKAGDWKNKCYRCGERGHVERSCRNSPNKLTRGRSYSRSPARSYSPRHGRSRSRSLSPSRSYSRSRSPARRVRAVEYNKRRSRSPQYRSSEPTRRSLTPDTDFERERGYSDSPQDASRSPSIGKMATDENNTNVGYPSKTESPSYGGVQNNVGSPNSSESPRPGVYDNDVGYSDSSEST